MVTPIEMLGKRENALFAKKLTLNIL